MSLVYLCRLEEWDGCVLTHNEQPERNSWGSCWRRTRNPSRAQGCNDPFTFIRRYLPSTFLFHHVHKFRCRTIEVYLAARKGRLHLVSTTTVTLLILFLSLSLLDYSPCLLFRVSFASILTRKDIHPFRRLNDQIRESLCAWSDNFEGSLKQRWILLRVDGVVQNIFLSLKMILLGRSVDGLLVSKSKYRLESEIRILRMLIIIENSRNFMYMKLFDRSVFEIVWNGELYSSLWLDIVMCNRRLWRFHDENEFCSISCC